MHANEFGKGFGITLSLVVLLSAPVALAASTVTSLADSGPGSLRDAIQNARPGDTIVFDVMGTITLSSTLTIPTNLTINGPDTSNLVISGNRQQVGCTDCAVQVFSISAGVTAAVSGVTIENGGLPVVTPTMPLGGGIYNAGTLTLTNIILSGNVAGQGGGIYNAGTLTVSRSTLSGNTALLGGGIYNTGTLTMSDTLTVSNSTLSGNDAGVGGGGIYNAGMLTLTNSTLSGNTALVGGGGGIYNSNTGTLTLTNSTLSGNFSAAEFNAGGILNSGTATVTNCTLSGNQADALGGGIYNTGTLSLTNSTLAGNSADALEDLGGGGIYNAGTLTVKNTIVASEYGGNCQGTVPISDGHNLSDDASCYFAGPGDLNNTPAGLDPGGLQNNGGPTQSIALLATSPAVDAVPVSPVNYCTLTDGTTPVATDQRGVLRPQSPHANCDIGAYEFATAMSLLATVQSQLEKSIAGGNGADKLELTWAAAQLSSALAAKNWTGSDGNHLNPNGAPQFFLEEGAAALDLTLLLNDKRSEIPPQEVQTDLDNLALANRTLAIMAITDAAGKNPTLLARASAQVSEGDQAAAAGNYDAAIVAYAAAWTLAEIAQ